MKNSLLLLAFCFISTPTIAETEYKKDHCYQAEDWESVYKIISIGKKKLLHKIIKKGWAVGSYDEVGDVNSVYINLISSSYEEVKCPGSLRTLADVEKEAEEYAKKQTNRETKKIKKLVEEVKKTRKLYKEYELCHQFYSSQK